MLSPLNDIVSFAAGRMCPTDYVYAPTVFDRQPDFACETLYVVGGLYGNLAALEEVERLASAEKRAPTIVFNGDFHWFDAEPEWFAAVERAVARHEAMRGNVETEIARAEDVGAGCGCAYPANVPNDVVRRSNEILADLRASVPAAVRVRLAGLPMHRLAQVGRLRIGIVHGDAVSLAGWRFAQDALDHPAAKRWLNEIRRASRIDLFASTHTCFAVLRDMTLPSGRLTVINNGSSGMPNFSGSRFGLLTRIATTPSPHPTLYGVQRDGVHADAIAVHYDVRAFLNRFLARWPVGSPAHASYFQRITTGPDYDIATAAG